MARRPEPIRKTRGNQRVRWLGKHDTDDALANKTDERSRFVEALAIVCGIDIVGDLLAAGSANPARHQTPAGNHVDHRELFCEPQWIVQEAVTRPRVAGVKFGYKF